MLLRRVMKHVRDENWLAVGIDFVIVVVGVFIGIQVANWNVERVERAHEADYVLRIAEDLCQDIKAYDAMLEIYSIKQQTILALRDAPLAQIIAGDLKKAALRLEYSLYKAMPAQRTATFDDLVGSGTLRVVRNSAFRAALADYYANHARLSEVLAQPLGDYARLLVGALPGEIPIENLQQADGATADRILAALENLRANPSFEAAANAEIYYGRDIHNWLLHFRERASDLLLMLDDPMASDR
jgi:hypothetical protein